MGSNAQFLTDVTSLTAAVQANTAAIASIKTINDSDNALIASLKAQILALQQTNPALDLSGLEADIASLQQNNVTAAGITAPPAPAPTQVPVPA